MSIKQAILLGQLAEIHGYNVNEKDDLINLVSQFDGTSTGWVPGNDAIEYLNCL